MNPTTKRGRRASFRRYVCDPYGNVADYRWWARKTDAERREHLRAGGFLTAQATGEVAG